MSDIASLSLKVDSDQVRQATVALKELPVAATAAEKAAQRWGTTTADAGRSADEFSKRVRNTIAALDFETQQMARNSDERAKYAALRRAGVSEMSAEGQAIARAVAGLQNQKAALTENATAVEKVKTSYEGMRHTLEVIGAIAIAEKLFEMAKAALESAAGLEEMAAQVGITANGLQALQFSAVQNGVKLDQLETGLSKFSQKIGEAAGGSKQMIDSLNDIGVKILDVNGKLKPTEQLLSEAARAILNIRDPAKQSAASVELFSRSGAKFIPMLKDMSEGLDVMSAAAKRNGAMISDEAIAKLDALADASERSGLKLRALFAENAAGPLTSAVETINNALSNMSRLLQSVTKDWKTLLLAIITQLRRVFPQTVNADTIKKLGIAPNNESYLINILVFLGLIDEEGKRLEAGHTVMTTHKEEDFHKAFGGLIKNAYADLFGTLGEDAWKQDRNGLVNYFRQTDKTSDVVGRRQAGTFLALAALAGHGEVAPEPKAKSTTAKPKAIPFATLNPGAVAGMAFADTPIQAATKAKAAAEAEMADMQTNLGMANTEADKARIQKAYEAAKAKADYNTVTLARLNAPKFGNSDILPAITVEGSAGSKPAGVRVDVPGWRWPLYICGKYEGEGLVCGGLDTVHKQAECADRAVKAYRYGHVLAEGLMSSGVGPAGTFPAAIIQAAGANVRFLHLDTPLAVCLARIEERRRAKGNMTPLDPENTTVKWHSERSAFRKLEVAGLPAYWLPYQRGFECVYKTFARADAEIEALAA